MLARVSLLLTGLVFGGFGVLLFVDPRILEIVGVAATAPMAVVELRAFYGGLELGLAAFFLLASFQREWHRAGLVAQVLALGGVAGGRLLAVVIAGAAEPLIWLLLSGEAAGALLGAAAMRSLR